MGFKVACGKRICWIIAKVLVLVLNGATFFTNGEEGSIVTHNGSVIPGKHKTKAR